MNHNLNTNYTFEALEILVPDWSKIDETNADHGNGSLGNATLQCIRDWRRPPTFLLVDYYKKGNFPGAVFNVAATANGMQHDNLGRASGSSRMAQHDCWVKMGATSGLASLVAFGIL